MVPDRRIRLSAPAASTPDELELCVQSLREVRTCGVCRASPQRGDAMATSGSDARRNALDRSGHSVVVCAAVVKPTHTVTGSSPVASRASPQAIARSSRSSGRPRQAPLTSKSSTTPLRHLSDPPRALAAVRDDPRTELIPGETATAGVVTEEERVLSGVVRSAVVADLPR